MKLVLCIAQMSHRVRHQVPFTGIGYKGDNRKEVEAEEDKRHEDRGSRGSVYLIPHCP